LPDDFLSVFSLSVVDATGAYSFLLNKDVNFIREAYPNPADTGTPKYYAVFGPDSATLQELTLILGPTPSNGLTAELHYFYYPTSITSNPTQILGTIQSIATRLSLGPLLTDGFYPNIIPTDGTGDNAPTGTGLTLNVTVSGGYIDGIPTVATGGSGYSTTSTSYFTLNATNFGQLTSGTVSLFSSNAVNIAGSNNTSWLGDNFDSALFNAVMVEAIRFMKGEPDLVAMYDAQYKQSLTLLKNLGDGKLRQDAYRSGQVRTQVI
jgi:hypothetical protein